MAIYNVSNLSFNNMYEMTLELNKIEPLFFTVIFFGALAITFIVGSSRSKNDFDALFYTNFVALVIGFFYALGGLITWYYFLVIALVFLAMGFMMFVSKK